MKSDFSFACATFNPNQVLPFFKICFLALFPFDMVNFVIFFFSITKKIPWQKRMRLLKVLVLMKILIS
jgi:hypothetical protein